MEMTKGWKVCFPISHNVPESCFYHYPNNKSKTPSSAEVKFHLNVYRFIHFNFLKIHIIVSSSSWIYLFLIVLHSQTVLSTCTACFVLSNHRLVFMSVAS